jgi:hypothetical protein
VVQSVAVNFDYADVRLVLKCLDGIADEGRCELCQQWEDELQAGWQVVLESLDFPVCLNCARSYSPAMAARETARAVVNAVFKAPEGNGSFDEFQQTTEVPF